MFLSKVWLFAISCFFTFSAFSFCDTDGWYTEGDFKPDTRIKITIKNPILKERPETPITIKRTQLPIQNIPERWITVVDPSLPTNEEPSLEMLKKFSSYLHRKETNGHYLVYQMDDLDKDGIWDELFFMIGLKAGETKTIYLYISDTERGLYQHKTHAGMGYYGRHMVPFWESEYIGWKLWYPTDVDLHGKREPMLTAYPEYSRNLAGYFMPVEYGTDIMAVSTTFGAGGTGLMEIASMPDSVSRPRFSPNKDKGPIYDTRYSFDVIANGPIRSIIKAKTMNWKTGIGEYELEQTYTAYANKSYSICQVRYTKFLPETKNVKFCCGIREIMNQNDTFQKGGTVISFGKNLNPFPVMPGNETYKTMIVEFEGIALTVKDSYKPSYKNIKGFGGNHIMTIPLTEDLSFEYMIAGGWSEGKVNNTPEQFKNYILTEAEEYNNPPEIGNFSLEKISK